MESGKHLQQKSWNTAKWATFRIKCQFWYWNLKWSNRDYTLACNLALYQSNSSMYLQLLPRATFVTYLSGSDFGLGIPKILWFSCCFETISENFRNFQPFQEIFSSSCLMSDYYSYNHCLTNTEITSDPLTSWGKSVYVLETPFGTFKCLPNPN